MSNHWFNCDIGGALKGLMVALAVLALLVLGLAGLVVYLLLRGN